MNRHVALALLTGCGSVTVQSDAAVTSDAAPAIDAATDASVPPPCDLTKPFGTPMNVAGVNTTSDDAAAWLTPDLLTIYFASAASGTTDRNIYTAPRSQPSGPFGTATVLTSVSSTGPDDRPVLSADGLTLFFESNRGGNNMDIHVATRPNTAADFSAPTPVAGINDATAIDWNPWISADGLTLLLGSSRSGNYDLYSTTRPNLSTMFAAPTAITSVNSTDGDYTPVLSADGRELFFASYRAGNNNNDIWRATRSTPSDGFGTPTLVAELSGATTDEYVTWLSPDRCTVLFTSTRTGGNGGQDIWLATRPQ